MPIAITSSNICIQDDQIHRTSPLQNPNKSLKFRGPVVLAKPQEELRQPPLQNQWLYHRLTGWLKL